MRLLAEEDAGSRDRSTNLNFDHLVHADWSVHSRKRWKASAIREDGRWLVSEPRPVGPIPAFLGALLTRSRSSRVLVGFDFPIGVPAAYGMKTGLADFRQALSAFGTGEWSKFFTVADIPTDVSLARPFYPRRARKGVTRKTLMTALGVQDFTDLLRACERATADQRAACSLFWTLGGNQVGRAAISGWLEVVRPALEAGARLWPFDGELRDLSHHSGLVLAETYPAAAYGLFGACFSPSESKRRQDDRKRKAAAILAWAHHNSVVLTREAETAVIDGFGSSGSGEDAFDGFAGLIKMIEVVDGRRPEKARVAVVSSNWEGWILGR